ncbi:hypothetical protein PybrP1_001872 [[Pythium] brassicae (nom. inval.)]|nr:hypothetical protein PybrP1_001872 [[Pythium] brassicae (nom. inval.)]
MPVPSTAGKLARRGFTSIVRATVGVGENSSLFNSTVKRWNLQVEVDGTQEFQSVCPPVSSCSQHSDSFRLSQCKRSDSYSQRTLSLWFSANIVVPSVLQQTVRPDLSGDQVVGTSSVALLFATSDGHAKQRHERIERGLKLKTGTNLIHVRRYNSIAQFGYNRGAVTTADNPGTSNVGTSECTLQAVVCDQIIQIAQGVRRDKVRACVRVFSPLSPSTDKILLCCHHAPTAVKLFPELSVELQQHSPIGERDKIASDGVVVNSWINQADISPHKARGRAVSLSIMSNWLMGVLGRALL